MRNDTSRHGNPPAVTLIPYGGLANRMKAIESVIGLARDCDVQARVIWFKDRGLNCPFGELFRPLGQAGIRLREARPADYLLFDRPRRKNLFVPHLFERMLFDDTLHQDRVTRKIREEFDFKNWILTRRRTYLSACTLFYPGNPSIRFDHFVPVASLQQQIDERIAQFPPYTVGIHIRRTDNLLSIRESPTELFIARMEEEIGHDPRVRFYLASDSREEKSILTKRFGNRIITAEQEPSRHTRRGMQDALVELYTLSKTDKILGSHSSSFSETAAQIGKIPFLKIRTETAK